MTFILPSRQGNSFLQDNKSDESGSIYQSRNINLDLEGKIKLAERSYAQWTTDDNVDFDTADAMFPSADQIYINSDEMFRAKMDMNGAASLASHTNAPTPVVEDDVIYFNGTEVVSDGATIKYRSASTTWTTVSGTGLPSTFAPTCMAVFQAENELAVARANTVKFITTSWGVNATTLILPNEYNVHTMCAVGDQLLIGTRSKTGSEAKVFLLSGSIKATPDYAYGIGAFEMFSMAAFKSSAVGLDSLGRLLRYNGGGFEVLATLPVYYSDVEWADSQNDYTGCSVRSLGTDGDLVFVNLSNYTQGGRYKVLPNFPGGVWCYDDTNGSFYHRYSPTYSRTQRITGTSFTISNNIMTIGYSALVTVSTGMPVIFQQDTIPQIQRGTAYYVIKLTDTTMKLAATYADAVAGNEITITGTPDSADVMFILQENDYGCTTVEDRNGLAVLNNTLFSPVLAGRLAFTNLLFAKQNVDTQKTVLCGISPFFPNRGYFITPKLTSTQLEDVYNSITLKFEPLSEDDSIIIKYKIRDKKNYPKPSTDLQRRDASLKSASWTNTTTFTTTTDLSDAEVGEEIEITAGVGSGHIAHISSISVLTGTYTVVLDEAYPFAVSGDVFYFNIDNFTILSTITNDSPNSESGYFTQSLTENTSKFVQFKIEMRGIGVTISEFAVGNKPHKPLQR